MISYDTPLMENFLQDPAKWWCFFFFGVYMASGPPHCASPAQVFWLQCAPPFILPMLDPGMLAENQQPRTRLSGGIDPTKWFYFAFSKQVYHKLVIQWLGTFFSTWIFKQSLARPIGVRDFCGGVCEPEETKKQMVGFFLGRTWWDYCVSHENWLRDVIITKFEQFLPEKKKKPWTMNY